MSLHVVGNVIAAVVMGGTVGLLGYWLLSYHLVIFPFLLFILGLISLAYAFDELNIMHLPHPQRTKQVPFSWQYMFHPYIAALLYGLGLGAGITTRIISGTFYILLIGAFLSASPFYAALSFGMYGLARGASILTAGWFIRDLHSERLDEALQWLGHQEYRMHICVGLILALLAGYWCTAFLLPNL